MARSKELVSPPNQEEVAREDVKRFLGQFVPEGREAAESLLSWAKIFFAPPRTFTEGLITSGWITAEGKTEVGVPNPKVPDLITYLKFNPSTDSTNEIEISQELEIERGSGRVVVNEGFKEIIRSVFNGEQGIILVGKDHALAIFKDGKVVFSERPLESNFFTLIERTSKG